VLSDGDGDAVVLAAEWAAARMRYKHFRSLCMFVGSGAVEAGCKAVIGQRLKLSGMRWSQAGRTSSPSDAREEIWRQPRNQTGAA